MMHKSELSSKRLLVLLVTVILLTLGVVAYDAYKAVTGGFNSMIFDMWLRSSSYGDIRSGMARKQITTLLGKPHEAALNPLYEVWDYNLPPNPKSGGNIYLVDGIKWDRMAVQFDPLGRVTGFTGEPVQDVLWPDKGPKPGMTKLEVRKLAGEPDDITDNSAAYYELWNYRLWNKTGFSILLDANGKVIRTRHVVSRAGFKD